MADTASFNYLVQNVGTHKNIKTQIMKGTIKRKWNITIRCVWTPLVI